MRVVDVTRDLQRSDESIRACSQILIKYHSQDVNSHYSEVRVRKVLYLTLG